MLPICVNTTPSCLSLFSRMSAHSLSAHIILFESENLRGHHIHVFEREADLSQQAIPGGGNFNDRISSFAILEGTWIFYENTALLRD